MSEKEIQNIFSKNLRYYLKLRNKTQLDLAKAIGVSNTTINNYVKGYNTPRMDKIDKICSFLNIERSNLLEDKKETNSSSGIKIAVLGTVPAGVPIAAIEDILDYEEIPKSWENQGEFFGLKIKGDSMYPTLEKGDVVIVRKQSTADNGDTVIAMVNGDDATCKRYERFENGIMLIPNNNAYTPTFYTNEDIQSLPVTIIGKVVELRRKF